MRANRLLEQVMRRSQLFFRFYSWFEKLKINSINFHKRPPILIYQMGKVGSTSITEALEKSSLDNPIFHIHWFSQEGLSRAEQIYKSTRDPVFRMHLQRCRLLRKKLDSRKITKFKVITLVRDPIAREISSFFQNIELADTHLIDSRNRLKTDVALKLIEKKITHNLLDVIFCLNWFEGEFEPALGVDIYDYPFDKEKGYTIIHHKNMDILVIKLENLNSCFAQSMSEFLGIRIKQDMVSSNRGNEKKYAGEMQLVKDQLKLDSHAYQKIYSTKLVKHFYSQDEIDAFIAHWSKQSEE